MNGKPVAAALLAALFLVLFVAAILPEALGWPAAAPSGQVGVSMWETRTFEVLLQGFVLLAGVVAILLLLGTRRTSEVRP